MDAITEPQASRKSLEEQFNELATLEPRLNGLLQTAKTLRTNRKDTAHRLWYGAAGAAGLKDSFEHLVGWGRQDGDPRLATSEAYDVVYGALYSALKGRRLQ